MTIREMLERIDQVRLVVEVSHDPTRKPPYIIKRGKDGQPEQGTLDQAVKALEDAFVPDKSGPASASTRPTADRAGQ